MKSLLQSTLLSVFCFIGISATPVAAIAEQVSIEDLFKDPSYGSIALSPDGKTLAVTARYKERLALAVIDMKTKEPKILSAPDAFDVARPMWVGNTRILFTGIAPGDKFSPKSANGGLYAIDFDGKNSKTLLDSMEQQGSKGAVIGRFGSILSRYGKSTDEILITYDGRQRWEPDVYRMNVRTGSKRMVAENPGGVAAWIADHNGAVRIGYGLAGKERFVIYRDSATGKFKEISRWQFGNEEQRNGFLPLAFDQDNKLLYVNVYHGDAQTNAIALYDPEAAKLVKVLFTNDTYDLENVMLDRNDYRLLGYNYEGDRGDEYVWTDKANGDLQAMINQELPDARNAFVSRSDDNTWIVVGSSSDRDPGTYYLFNSKQMTMEKLIRPMEWINPEKMSVMRPIVYKARDGMTMHGYLTLPVGKEPKNLPLIVNPHGGPWARDSWGFSPDVQFLASRGYAVLQMDFRGSLGYGRKHERAGYGQWGLSMQDDITDAVHWALAQGYFDPKRVAIYGASYGGFATMAGLAFTPELYRCGVNYVGVTDVKLLLKTIPRHWESMRAELEAKAGDAKKDGDTLDKSSPMKNADLIKAPVFFVYGQLDERVDLKHATRFISKLKSNGIPVEFMVKNNEGHGFRILKNQIDYYTALEKFLAKYLD